MINDWWKICLIISKIIIPSSLTAPIQYLRWYSICIRLTSSLIINKIKLIFLGIILISSLKNYPVNIKAPRNISQIIIIRSISNKYRLIVLRHHYRLNETSHSKRLKRLIWLTCFLLFFITSVSQSLNQSRMCINIPIIPRL